MFGGTICMLRAMQRWSGRGTAPFNVSQHIDFKETTAWDLQHQGGICQNDSNSLKFSYSVIWGEIKSGTRNGKNLVPGAYKSTNSMKQQLSGSSWSEVTAPYEVSTLQIHPQTLLTESPRMLWVMQTTMREKVAAVQVMTCFFPLSLLWAGGDRAQAQK